MPIATMMSLSANQDELQATIDRLQQFRQQLHASLQHRPDAILSLLDALCSNTNANSVVQLSLNENFNHSYNSVYDAIHSFSVESDNSESTTQEPGKRSTTTKSDSIRKVASFSTTFNRSGD